VDEKRVISYKTIAETLEGIQILVEMLENERRALRC
jgi:hypothetical protein